MILWMPRPDSYHDIFWYIGSCNGEIRFGGDPQSIITSGTRGHGNVEIQYGVSQARGPLGPISLDLRDPDILQAIEN